VSLSIGMAAEHDELGRMLAEREPPICAALTPFKVQEANLGDGWVILRFEAQPAFSNHFEHVQGGFAAAMLDAVISVAAFAATRRWLPMANLSISFLRPVPIAPCFGEARVLQVGQRMCFVEARLFGGERVFVTAQATLANASA
jgi:uncharacterized protein (TIGR00369 family)